MSIQTSPRLVSLAAIYKLSTTTTSTRTFIVAANYLRYSSALRPQLPSVIRYASIMIKVPQMAESISEGTLKQWQKSVGDHVEQDEEVATIETDKIDVAVNAPEAGVLTEFFAKEEDTVTVGQDIARLEIGATAAKDSEAKETSEPEPPKQQQQQQQQQQPQQQPLQQPPPPPSTQESKPKRAAAPESSASGAPKPAATSDSDPDSPIGSRREHRTKMGRPRLRTAERLKQSQNTTASLTTFQEVDMTELVEFRNKNKDDVLKRTGVKLGFMGAFARACVLAMRDFPVINAAIEESGDTVVYRDYVDISVAVSTEKGLVTPVIRNVETMDIITIEKSIAEMGQKARDRKLTIEDMAGGTFTISNGGVFGSLMGTPIINMPQSAVLGLHAIKERPAIVNGKIEARKLMYLALTYDHRLLDGREAVLFLVRIKELIEDPRRMLL